MEKEKERGLSVELLLALLKLSSFLNLTKIRQAIAASSRPLVLCINLGVDSEVKIMTFGGNVKLKVLHSPFIFPKERRNVQPCNETLSI